MTEREIKETKGVRRGKCNYKRLSVSDKTCSLEEGPCGEVSSSMYVTR